MSFTDSGLVIAGDSYTSETWSAQLLDTAGSNVGSAVTTGFVHLGTGNYSWVYASFPDGFRGTVRFTSSPTGLVRYAPFGQSPANVTQWLGTALATPDTAGYPKITIKAGTGTGELNVASGKAPSTLAIADVGTIDGVAYAALMTNINAFAKGIVVPTDNGNGTITFAFKKEDGTTTAFTRTYTKATGARS